jgi:diadenosine tetraphosphate (Ap4A) HIT family hydrolase
MKSSVYSVCSVVKTPGMRILLFLVLVGVATAQEAKPCVFCEIIAGTRQQEGIVYRDEQVIAFLSIGPRNPGHVLVVPLAHAAGFLDVPAGTMHAMTDAAQKIAAAIKRTDLKMEGFTIQLNTGPAAGQSVFHAHLHIIPRFAGEAPAKTPEERVSMETLAPVAAKIRAALADAEDRERKTEDGQGKASALGATRATFELPKINEEVPLARIKEICAHYGLQALWAKIEKDPPVRPFKSDGCTGWFDEWQGVSIYPAGFLHDLKYWAGYPGEDVERLAADAELMTDVARLLGSTGMAETMFHGVRVGGAEALEASFSWGFGRQRLPAQ